MKERDRMQILLEDIRDKIQLLAEGQGMLQDNYGQLKVTVEQVRTSIEQVQLSNEQLRQDVRRIDKKVDQNQVTLYALNDKLDEHMKQPSHA